MSNNLSKTIITLVMWIVTTAILFFSGNNIALFGESWVILPLYSVGLFLCVFLTLAFWAPEVLPWVKKTDDHAQISNDTGKRKNEALSASSGADVRLQFLLQTMDDEEREVFKNMLKRRVLEEASVGEDGEIDYNGVSLSDLLDDDQLTARRH